MNIGIVCQKASTGGWRYTLMLACALKRLASRPRVTVHCQARRLPPGGLETLESAGVEVVRLPKPPAMTSPWPPSPKRFVGLKAVDQGLHVLRRCWTETTRAGRGRRLARAVADHDVVHFAWPYDLDPPAVTVPMSFIPHDFIHTHDFGVANYGQRAWIATRQAHERWLASAAPIVSSDFIAHELRRTFPGYAGPVDVVYLSSLYPAPAAGIDPRAVAEMRRRFGLPKRYILCPNNIMPHKNLSSLLAALWHMRQGGSDVQLVICGAETDGIRATVGSPLYADRTDSATAWDVLGLGLVSDADLLALVHGALIVVNPSLCEAGSGSALDAWGSGCPVALSDIPAFRDQVRVLGASAEFFDPRDPRDIARVLLGMLAAPDRSAHAATAARAALARYGWDDVAAGYLAFFERLLGSPRRGRG